MFNWLLLPTSVQGSKLMLPRWDPLYLAGCAARGVLERFSMAGTAADSYARVPAVTRGSSSSRAARFAVHPTHNQVGKGHPAAAVVVLLEAATSRLGGG
jgi:hypothetical protein